MNNVNKHLSDAIFKANLDKASADMNLIQQAFDYAGKTNRQLVTGVPGPLFFAILTEHKILYNLAMTGLDNILDTVKDAPEYMLSSPIRDAAIKSLETYRIAFEQSSKVTKDVIKDQYETLKGIVLP